MSPCSVSIVICTAGRPQSLRDTISSFHNLRIPNEVTVELLVVDNDPESVGASDFTIQPELSIRYLTQPIVGKCHALNFGLAVSQGDLLVFTDDDIRVEHDWIENLIRPIVDGEADCVAGTVRIDDNLIRPWMTDYIKAWYAEVQEPRGAVFDMVGANMAFHRRVLQRVTEFDIRLGPGALGAAEETLFSIMARTAGFRLVSVSDAEVTHCFDPSRLKKSWLTSCAERSGRSWGYVAHHWDNMTIPQARAKKQLKAMELAARRVLSMFNSPSIEGCGEGELHAIFRWAYLDQFLIESREPAKYPERWKIEHLKQ